MIHKTGAFYSATFQGNLHLIAIEDLNSQISLTYSELQQEVFHLAKKIEHLKNSNSCVVLDMLKTKDFIIAQLACSYLSLAFVPLDFSQEERNNLIVETVKPSCIINSLDEMYFFDDYQIFPEDCEYIIFSSGSTGKPKGILLKGAPAIDVVTQQAKIIGIEPGESYLWLLNPAFDASLSDIYSTFVAKGKLVIPNFPSRQIKSLMHTLTYHVINYIDLPPSMFKIFENSLTSHPLSLKAIIFGGETAPLKETISLSKRFKMIQAYGPTETTICSSMNVVDDDWIPSNIGQPLDGLTFSVVNQELYISGNMLCIEYLNNDELNSSRFLNNPVRTYKTGDIVEFVNGNYHYKGRKDRQFKFHSQLICPEEIEDIATTCGANLAHVKFDGKITLIYQGNFDKNRFEQLVASYMKPHFYEELSGNLTDYLNSNMKINHKEIK